MTAKLNTRRVVYISPVIIYFHWSEIIHLHNDMINFILVSKQGVVVIKKQKEKP